MFVVIYQPTDQPVEIVSRGEGEISLKGEWIVDTGEHGEVATYDDLPEALSRVLDIRKKGGEACLAVIIE